MDGGIDPLDTEFFLKKILGCEILKHNLHLFCIHDNWIKNMIVLVNEDLAQPVGLKTVDKYVLGLPSDLVIEQHPLVF